MNDTSLNRYETYFNNKPVSDNIQACRLMVTTNMIAESARNPNSFFALFAMLELMQRADTISYNSFKPSWKRLVALPERVEMDIKKEIKSENWINLIIADGLDALGGIHPMAHNGSFFKRTQTFPPVVKNLHME